MEISMRLFSRSWLLPVLFLLIGANAWSAATVFNVLDYGAHNDGSAPATEAIRSAIQAAKAAGGGTVYFPAGNYVTGPIELVSNLVLHIDAGATLNFPATKLPFTKGRAQGIECLTPVPLIAGTNVENVTITGRGAISTNNAEWTKLLGGPQREAPFGPVWAHLRELLEQKTPQPEEEYLKAAPTLRPDFVRFMESKNILIEGIHIVGSPFWTVHLLYSTNAVVRDVNIETYPGSFTDGIVVDSSKDVRIANCYLDNGDDAIVLKSGKDADGLRVNRSTENVTVTNCIVHHGSAAVTLGSEMSGSIRNVVVSNIACQGTSMGLNIKSDRGRGGVVENVRMDHWTMDDVGRAINVTQYYVLEARVNSTEQKVSERTPVYRNIVVDNMSINRCRGTVGFERAAGPVMINIEGLPEMPISGLRLTNIIALGKSGLKAHDTVGMELHNVQVNTDSGPAFLIRDSKELELDGVSTREPLADVPVIRLDRCPGAILRSSRAFAGTGTFLSAAMGELKSVVLEGNTFTSARTPTAEAATDFWLAAK
jgi:polygalacturonase